MFAIQVCQQETNKRVGHLPMEISRITKFLIDRGARIQATLTSTHYRRSPLVRGGLEIPCEITVQITNGDHRKELLERYEILLNDLYLEPVTDVVVGCFLEVETILEAPEAQNVVTKKKKVESKDKVKVKSKDIRSMFTNVSKEIEVSNAETQHVIEISDSDSEL